MKKSTGKKLPISFAPIDNPRARKIIYVLALVILLAVGGLKIKPGLDNQKKLDAQAVSISQEIQDQKNELANLRNTQTEKGTQAQNLSRVLLKALPQNVANDVEAGRLSGLASYTKVKISDISFAADAADTTGSRKKSIQLSVSGSYENLLRFIGGLTSLTKLTGNTIVSVGPVWSIDTISLAAGGGTAATPAPTDGQQPSQSSSDELSMQITGSLYLAPTGKTTTPTDPNATPTTPTTPPTTGANP